MSLSRRLFFCFCTLLVWLALARAVAATLAAPATFPAEVGGFVSVPVIAEELTGGEQLEVTVPDALQLVGIPTLRKGRALVNLLVAKGAGAGSYGVQLQLLKAGQVVARAEVMVQVALEAGLELRAPEGQNAVAGDEVRYTLILTNTGNSADTVRLEVESSLAARLEPAVMQLPAGATAAAQLLVRAQGRSRDLAIVRARSGIDPKVTQTAVIETEVLAFAGADALDGPALLYGLGAAGAYTQTETLEGSEREYDYLLGASLDGELSDYLRLESGVEFENGVPSWALGLEADTWDAAYVGSLTEQSLGGSYGPLSGFLSVPLALDGFSTVLSFQQEGLNGSYTHESDATNSDTLSAGYTWNVTPDLGVIPSLSVRGQGLYQPGSYFVTGAVGLGANAQTEVVVGNAQIAAALPCAGCEPSGEAWRAAAFASSRAQTPLGVQGELSLTPQGFGLAAASNQELGEEVTLNERFSYVSDYQLNGRSVGSFGVSYQPLLVPIDVAGALGISLEAGLLAVTSGLSGSYTLGNVVFGALVSQDEALGYGSSVSYNASPYSAALIYAHNEDGDLLSLGVSGELGGSFGVLTGVAATSYNLTDSSYQAILGLDYEFAEQYQAFGELELERDLVSFRVGAALTFESGFATPGGIVAAFGGRAGGLVTGTAFRDTNRNGTRDAGEAAVAGLEVRAGPLNTITLPDGSYRLILPAGEQQLSLAGLPANLGVTGETSVRVAEGQTFTLPLAIEEVVNLTGTVIDDADRDRKRTGQEAPLPYVGVILEGAEEERYETRSNAEGGFFFQSLAPGIYTLSLETTTLPERFETTSPPQTLTLTLGPSPRVTLGATAKPKVIEQTLSAGDLSLFVTATPNPAAPGGSLNVVVEVTGNPERVVALLGAAEQELVLRAGRYSGRITVPAATQGVAPLSVRAERGNASATQQALVIVNPDAPLAQLEVSPALVDIGEQVTISGDLYVDAARVILRVGGQPLELTRPTPYTFSTTLVAPEPAGTYEVELVVSEKVIANTRFRVDTPN